MRTTITLDPDVEVLVKKTMRERGNSFKETINDAIRAGLTHHKGKTAKFEQQTFSMGSEQNFRWDKALEAAALMEEEELSRKLAMRK
jgi:hypothetical protein